jgi:hypothetical protein
LVVLGVGAALALPVGLFAPHGTFFAGMVVGSVVALGLWVWYEPPNYVERWRQGRDGERWTAKELRKLRSQGWSARHDLEDRYGNIDHVVAGPGGVFLLDSKNLWGTVRVEDGILTCHHESSPRSDYSMPKQPHYVQTAAWAVERRLKERLGWIVDVRPVLVVWAAFPDGEATVDGVTVVRGDLLADWLRTQPLRIAPADRTVVGGALATLPAAVA